MGEISHGDNALCQTILACRETELRAEKTDPGMIRLVKGANKSVFLFSPIVLVVLVTHIWVYTTCEQACLIS